MEQTAKNNKLNRSIKDAIQYLKGHFQIDEAILFGSQAIGTANEFSDIDLAVISPDFKDKSYKEILQVFCDLALKYGPEVEIRPYTPDDVKTARPTNFLGFIMKTGKTVYKNGKLLI